MKLQFVHLCPQRMSLYGEYANLVILQRMAQALGHEVEIVAGETPDLSHAHLIYMGCGTERGQKFALDVLRPQVEGLKGALARGAVVLFTGNAMELLGTCVTDQAGKTWPCLALADYVTAETDRRVPEDVIAHTALWEEPVVGFMNKCSHTTGVTSPLFDRLTLGEGNESEKGPEGYVSCNLFATHLTGPVLVKNPAFLRLMIQRIFQYNGWTLPETLPSLPHEEEAYQVTLRELSARTGG